MAQFIRSAKSGNEWSKNELTVYNIVIQDANSQQFFGADLPPTTVSPVFLHNDVQPAAPVELYKDIRLLFTSMERAKYGEEVTVHDLSQQVYRTLKYDDNNRLIVTKREMSFMMSGDWVQAKPRFCILDENHCVCIVQESKRSKETREPEGQLVAEAVAVFTANNQFHPRLLSETIPGITMVGPRPIFYKIPVTQSLVDALASAKYPEQPTIVQRLVPPVPDPASYRKRGMIPLENRTVVFQCFEAMRELLVS